MNDFKKKYKVDVTNIIKDEMKEIRIDKTLTNREKRLQLKRFDKVIDKIEEEER